MTSLQPTTQTETGASSSAESPSVSGARSLGAELMELFVRKQEQEVSEWMGRS